jgi:hypothetical protein
MEKYFHDEKFEFFDVKTFDMGYYGFNQKFADQRATAKKIIKDVNYLWSMVGKLHGTFQNGYIVTTHGMTS